jgi:hypothetical protein
MFPIESGIAPVSKLLLKFLFTKYGQTSSSLVFLRGCTHGINKEDETKFGLIASLLTVTEDAANPLHCLQADPGCLDSRGP